MYRENVSEMAATSNTHTSEKYIHLSVRANVTMRKPYANTSQYFPPEFNKTILAISL